MFIVKSGTGYFTGFNFSADSAQTVTTPCMTSDPLSAKRLGRDDAERVIVEMDRMGFVAELVELVRARINNYCYVIISPGGSDLREALAAYAHEARSGWMRHLFEKSAREHGAVIIPAWAVEQWGRQMNTEYCDLSDDEQEDDRKEADKMLAIMRRHGGQAQGRAVQPCKVE